MERVTPLADVIRHLPTEVVDVLNRCDSFVQVGVLSGVREFISDCEIQGVVFDPVMYESVLKALTPILVGHSLLTQGLMVLVSPEPDCPEDPKSEMLADMARLMGIDDDEDDEDESELILIEDDE